ncbi:CoA transferase [Gordonia hydrophobica]|uniref:CoA transferase n=1 Tax=Gordonia hydrophobica TaxID=40516 RepID=A0ABZ2U1Z1_9ACTN|nr:CoA transferase [Gordonia hydrophobica]MBM7369263.1 hypothetical protein [Gordonia hydrophobica]
MTDHAGSWADTGLAWLTGDPDGPGDVSRAAVLEHARAIAAPMRQDAAALLAGRAALTGLRRRGATSAGGATRLLSATDGWVAATLSRPQDVDSVAAVVESNAMPTDPWRALADFAARTSASEFADRAQLLGIPASALGAVPPAEPRVTRYWAGDDRHIDADLLVVDLSSMWAGPLCGMILRELGASVVKVESPRRPDGTRLGDSSFFTWMNGGKHVCRADLHDDTAAVARLLDAADVVIEASRPRALAQTGLDAASRAPRTGRVWVRITGYGPDHPDRVAFGDDAAVAGGLVGAGAHGPVFCGDAIADPLTGITAAHQVIESLRRGGGEVIDVAMAEVAATYAALPITPDPPSYANVPPAQPAIPITPPPDAAFVEQLVHDRSATPC